MENQLENMLDSGKRQSEMLRSKLIRLEAIQRKTEYRLKEAQQLAHIGFWELDLQEDKLFWSDEIYRIFEIQPEQFDATYEAFLELVHPDDREMVNQAYLDSLKTQEPYDLIHRLLFQDGRTKYVHEHCRTLFDDSGKPLRSFGTVQDISELKSMEHQLIQSQKMESVGRLAAGVAHEINNILTGILGYCELALVREQTDPNLHECLTQISHSGEKAANVVQQLLAFGRKDISNPKLFDLHSAVQQLQKLLKKMIGEDIQLRTRLDADQNIVYGDQGLIEQAIVNLVINARDAMPKGGKITLRTENRSIAVNSSAPSHYIILCVEDEGTGIPPEKLHRVFEPFYTTKAAGKGTGLGLSIVKNIMEQHQSSIDVQSTPGRGTQFSMAFATHNEKPVDPGVPQIEELPGGSEHVLLVDDDATVRNFTEFLLKSYGYSCIVAANGNEAFQKAKACSHPIDVLLTDVILPGMNGRELAKSIQTFHPKVLPIFISGYAANVLESAGVQESDDNFIAKPLKPSVLLKRLRVFLDAF